MNCSMCGYLMEPFDTECPRCHGKGLQPPTPPPSAAPPAAPPVYAAPPGQTPPAYNAPPAYGAPPQPYGGLPPGPGGVQPYGGPPPHGGPPPYGGPPHGGPPPLPRAPAARASQTRAMPFVVAACVLLVALLGYRYYTRTPLYSLWQAQRAASAHDLTKFERYVDIDGCVDGALEDIFAAGKAEMQARQGNSGNQFEKAGRQMAEGFAALLKASLVPILSKQIRNYVENGKLDGGGGGGMFDSATESIQKSFDGSNVKFGGVQYVKHEDNHALVGLKFINQTDADKSLDIELKMRWKDDHWQVSRWNNIGEMIKKLGNAAAPAGAPAT